MSKRFLIAAALTAALTGCQSSSNLMSQLESSSSIMPRSSSYEDLTALPQPKGKIFAAVYDFRDQSGQYKPIPDSNFSTAVPQGTTAFLAQVLMDSNWFIPVEREGLQNMLTERKIIRANLGETAAALPKLASAQVILEGGVVAYDNNMQTGGLGARYLGVGASTQYRQDRVTVNLRAVDIRTGQILSSITTTKTVLSQELTAGVFKFIDAQELLESEVGITVNEPVSLCVMSAIEAAVIHLIIDGVKQNHWQPMDFEQAASNEIFKKYGEQRNAPPMRGDAL